VIATVTRPLVEDFLYKEAALLDEWRLDEWLTLFEPGATYEVPTTDRPNADPHSSQYYVWDDHELLTARVRRLKSKHAHAENPHSRTRRLITNVRMGEPVGRRSRRTRPSSSTRSAMATWISSSAATSTHSLRAARVFASANGAQCSSWRYYVPAVG